MPWYFLSPGLQLPLLLPSVAIQAEHHSFNVGVYAAASNERTLLMMERWLAARDGEQDRAGQSGTGDATGSKTEGGMGSGTNSRTGSGMGPGASSSLQNEQFALNAIAEGGGWLCSDPESCGACHLAGLPALFRHPPQFGASGHCPPPLDATRLFSERPCDPERLFVHAICSDGWDGPQEGSKSSVYSRYHLWLVDEEGEPLSGVHEYLPCKGLAWEP